MNRKELESEILEKRLDAPRVTLDRVEEIIHGEDYHTFPGSLLTICCLTLENGFTVTGESACASPENFNESIGRKVAREKAKEKIWALEGYVLKQRLFEEELN